MAKTTTPKGTKSAEPKGTGYYHQTDEQFTHTRSFHDGWGKRMLRVVFNADASPEFVERVSNRVLKILESELNPLKQVMRTAKSDGAETFFPVDAQTFRNIAGFAAGLTADAVREKLEAGETLTTLSASYRIVEVVIP